MSLPLPFTKIKTREQLARHFSHLIIFVCACRCITSRRAWYSLGAVHQSVGRSWAGRVLYPLKTLLFLEDVMNIIHVTQTSKLIL